MERTRTTICRTTMKMMTMIRTRRTTSLLPRKINQRVSQRRELPQEQRQQEANRERSRNARSSDRFLERKYL